MPVEQGARHYRGPEAQAVPAPPPMPAPMRPPAMPPAEELMPPPTPPLSADEADLQAFTQWFEQRIEDDENPAGVAKLERILAEAFFAGANHVRRQAVLSARAPAPLEGTVESRTIVAALAYFRDQVLAHRPEEVATGEWLNATDVDVLIQAIQRKGRL